MSFEYNDLGNIVTYKLIKNLKISELKESTNTTFMEYFRQKIFLGIFLNGETELFNTLKIRI